MRPGVPGGAKGVPLVALQTDNGSEFLKHFDKATEEELITHYFSHPHCPKENSHVERKIQTTAQVQKHSGHPLYLLLLANRASKEASGMTVTVGTASFYHTRLPHQSKLEKMARNMDLSREARVRLTWLTH